MNCKFSFLSVIAVIAIFCLAAIVVSARPLTTPAKTSIAKQTVKTGTPISFADRERVILNGTIEQITIGTKMPLEELQRFDFKIGTVTKRLDGHVGKQEHIPIVQRSRCLTNDKESSFY